MQELPSWDYNTICKNALDGDISVLEFLKDDNALSAIADTPYFSKLIHIACQKNYANVVTLMLEKYPEKIAIFDIHHNTPLLKALQYNNVKVAILLLSMGNCRVDLCNDQQYNILHVLSNIPFEEFTHLLCQRIVDEYPLFVNRKNIIGETPMHLACLNGNVEFVKFLFENRASITELTNQKKSVRDYAIFAQNNSKILLDLIDSHVIFNDKYGSPLRLTPSPTNIESPIINESLNVSGSPQNSPSLTSSTQLNNTNENNEEEEATNQRTSSPSGIFDRFFRKEKSPRILPEDQYRKYLSECLINERIIISVDGGGIKCILQAIVISRLVEKFPMLLEDVNLFCGVSASSFICADLALGYSPKDIKHIVLIKKSRGLTSAIYSNKYIINISNITFGDKMLSDIPKHILINSFLFDTGENDANRSTKACLFNNFIPGCDCKISDACLRSAAAPGYFPPYQGYADGGIYENNPVTCAFPFLFGEKGIGIDVSNTVCLSISSGKPPINYIDIEKYTDVGVVQLLPIAVDGFLWSRKNMSVETGIAFLGERYKRFDPVLSDKLDLDCADHIDRVVEVAEQLDLTDIEEWVVRHWI
ncbi:phospholipase A2 [Entamoeba marina]